MAHIKNSYGNINYIPEKNFFNLFILFIEYIYTTVAIGTSNKKEGKNNDKWSKLPVLHDVIQC
jgi:hypothetical protein